MAYQLCPVIVQRFFDANGVPLAGGKLYSYIAGSSVPLSTFQDAAGSVPNTNPIILDSAGQCNVYVNLSAGSYKFVLTDSNGAIQWTRDNIQGSNITSPASGWSTYTFTDGQAPTNLLSQTVDLSLYSGAVYDIEVLRGAVASFGRVVVQSMSGTGRLRTGPFIGDNTLISFSISQAGSVCQLQLATTAGLGAGTIKVYSTLLP